MIEWILGGGMLAVVGLMLSLVKAQDSKMEKVCGENELRITRAYQRVDEVKNYQDKTFTRQDMCNLTHKQVTETLHRIEEKVDKILSGAK